MKCAATVCLALLLTSIPMVGQRLASTQLTSHTVPAEARGCPVSMHAQHLADGGLLRTSGPAKGVGQSLHISLADNHTRQVVAATITIHGYSDKGRITQAASGDVGADLARTVVVPFAAASTETTSGDIWVSGMTAVENIDLDSVTYTDGSVWKIASQPACEVALDPLMLIAGR
jgi:hypothetical protein